ncbi:MarR family winged helix-turn-helix transcriptional regulator [Streptomyces sp. NBC_00102]|uniref:MarR family winged helix-turn-helix transcriptional regulator n=1 Tax=Streptomyces sp. NBC_00102 TaxID=2975652 RepID=UPI00225BB456|nr:MarR family transcriptional regulator [Streptomyces sp. NBC_00102]MCX5398973.1 MarR family transcriptional regulator [Streptomyces sp. NBC_00102]
MSFQLVLAEFGRRLEAAGHADVRPVHGMVFQLLQHSGATSTELADRLGVTKQAAGQIVDYLEKRGYVERHPHPAGGRRRLVALTAKAREHLAAAGHVLHGLESQLADQLHASGLRLPRAELAGLVRALAGDTPPPLRPVW